MSVAGIPSVINFYCCISAASSQFNVENPQWTNCCMAGEEASEKNGSTPSSLDFGGQIMSSALPANRSIVC